MNSNSFLRQARDFLSLNKGIVGALLLALLIIGGGIHMAVSAPGEVELPEVLEVQTLVEAEQAQGQHDGQNASGTDNSRETSAQNSSMQSPLTQNASAQNSTPEYIYVHVAGEVKQPGLIRLPGDSRLAEAIEAAQGFTDQAQDSAVNLARPLQDGEQIYVPNKAEASGPAIGATAGNGPDTGADNNTGAGENSAAGGTGVASASINSNGLVNINLASSAELETLPGIGPSIAGKIIEYREANGNFASIEQLQEVKGIGPAIFAKLQEKITV